MNHHMWVRETLRVLRDITQHQKKLGLQNILLVNNRARLAKLLESHRVHFPQYTREITGYRRKQHRMLILSLQ